MRSCSLMEENFTMVAGLSDEPSEFFQYAVRTGNWKAYYNMLIWEDWSDKIGDGADDRTFWYVGRFHGGCCECRCGNHPLCRCECHGDVDDINYWSVVNSTP